ncbi:hypothetical protein PQX77_021985 [Marasmius sp. AFHP31]|nr:hypothetical protein PQX77_021985 [Marasmius sp. AFHP31]
MSPYGAFYSTHPESQYTLKRNSLPCGHPQTTYSFEKRCPMSFAHKLSSIRSTSGKQSAPKGHEYSPPGEGDVRSVCPALNTMANHGYIPRDGRNLTFLTILYGLKECYGLSTPLAIVLVVGGFFLIGRYDFFSLPFTVPDQLAISNPDGSKSQPGVIDLKLVGLHGGVEHNASLVHADCPHGSKYPSIGIKHDWVGNLVGDVLPAVKGYVKDTELSGISTPPEHVASPCSCTSIKGLKEGEEMEERLISSSSSIISRLEVTRTASPSSHRRDGSTDSSSVTVVDEPEDIWRQFTTKAHMDTLVSEADVGRMRARRERECEGKKMTAINREIARGEMGIILGVWERSVDLKDGKVKKGIPLPWLLTWLAEERLPEGWKPDRVQGLWDVRNRSKAIRKTAEAIGLASLY